MKTRLLVRKTPGFGLRPAWGANLRLLVWVLLAGLLLKPGAGWGQAVSTYSLSATAGTYAELTEGTAVPAIHADNAISVALPLGFTFLFEGTPYTQVRASSDGFLSFNTGATRTGTNDLSTGAAVRRPLVAPLWDDLDGRAITSTATSQASYRTTGTAPFRVFTFEWRNWEWNYTVGADVISFQAVLYESTKQVQFVYRQDNAAVVAGAASIGLSGVGTGPGSFVSLQNASANPTVSTTTENKELSSRPATGQVYTFTPPAACSGVPVPGAALASPAQVCAGNPTILSLTGPAASGLTFQWQSSADNVTYADIEGAVNSAYTAAPAAETWYRAVLTCTVVGQTATSAPALVSLTTATYAALPVEESFEGQGATPAWLSLCNTREVPGASWRNLPATGNASWRRFDDGVAAAWRFPNDGTFGPIASQGSFSARYHSAAGTSGDQGSLDLYVDLSAAGTKTLTFDYRNLYGTDRLDVLLSTDGGKTFAAQPILTLGNNVPSFTNQSVTFTANSATSVIRLRGTSDVGLDDIGLDNLRLETTPACPAVTLTPVTNITATSATISFGNLTPDATYLLSYAPAGSSVPQTVAASPVTLTGLLPGTEYTVSVTTNCGASGAAAPATIRFQTIPANDECAGAISLTPGAPEAACISPTPGTIVSATKSAGVAVCQGKAGDNDVWYSFVATSGQHLITVAGDNTGGGQAFDAIIGLLSGTCDALTGLQCEDANGMGGTETMVASALTIGQTYYVRVTSFVDRGSKFTICVTTPAACSAPTRPLVVIGSLKYNQVAISFVASNGATGGYTITATPTAGGTPVSVTGLASPLTLTGLTAATPYAVTVRSNCDEGKSATSAPALFLQTTPAPPANDDPTGAVALTVGATCVPTAGTTAFATETTPNGYANDGNATSGCDHNGDPLDVWYTFTTAAAGPASTGASITANGTVIGLIRVYSAASAAGPFTRVGCSAASGSNRQAPPLDLLGLSPATTYYVAVSGYSSGNTTGPFTICVAEPPVCAAPANVSASGATSSTATITFTAAGGAESYTVTAVPNEAGGITKTATGPASPIELTNLVAGTNYTVTVTSICAAGATAVSVQPYTLRIPAMIPANDDPTGAVALTLGATCVPVTGTARAGTTTLPNGYVNGSAPDCAPATSPIDVWYTFTTATAGSVGSTDVTVSVGGTVSGLGNPAGQVRVFAAPTAAGPFSQVACATGSSFEAAPPLALTRLTPATTYFVRVAGYENLSSIGTFTICAVGNATPERVAPTLPAVTIASTNADPTRAIIGDVVTLRFTRDEPVLTPVVSIAGRPVTVATVSATSYSASYPLTATDPEGPVAFRVDFTDLAGNQGLRVTATTDASRVVFDRTAPTGYAVAFTQDLITVVNRASVTAQVTGAEVGVSYTFTVTSAAGGTPVTGTAAAPAAAFTTPAFDVTGLNDGLLTITFSQQDATGKGPDVTATVLKTSTPVVTATTTGQHAPTLSIYPNPASTTLTVDLPGASALAVRITDMRGAVVRTVSYQGTGKVDVDVSTLPVGLYVVTISSGQQVYHRKFTKQ